MGLIRPISILIVEAILTVMLISVGSWPISKSSLQIRTKLRNHSWQEVCPPFWTIRSHQSRKLTITSQCSPVNRAHEIDENMPFTSLTHGIT